MGLKSWIGQKLLQWKGETMLKNWMGKVDGYKTYLTAGLGVAIAVAGHFWGPIHVGPVDLPSVDSAGMWKLIWEAAGLVFLRNGVRKAELVEVP